MRCVLHTNKTLIVKMTPDSGVTVKEVLDTKINGQSDPRKNDF